MKNIVFIGMPGVGKSTIGVILAKILGYSFIDSDLVIQETTGKLLKDIITAEGVEGFLAVENHINSTITGEKAIIATGGSAVYGAEAMAHFQKIAVIVYLKADYETLASRLKNIKNRGVVFKEGQTLMDIYQERIPLYEKYAHVIIDTKNDNTEEVVAKVGAAIESFALK